MSIASEIERLNAIKDRIRMNLVAQGITVPADTMLDAMANQILSVAGEPGATFTPNVDSSGNLSWSNDQGLDNPSSVNINGESGATFTPGVTSSGSLYWTNDKGLPNPSPTNVKGPKGDVGATGPKGDPFVYSDFTAQQLEDLRGPAGVDGKEGPIGPRGETGPQGATFTPAVDSSGNLSWTNDKNLANPTAVNIKGPKGDKGDTGATGQTGLKGETGAAGKGIKSAAVTYQVGTSATSVPTGTWSSTIVSTSVPGQYLWTRTITTYTDSTKTTAYSIASHGATGATGPKGDTGAIGPTGQNGAPGATFTPVVDTSGNLSWTNNKGLANPTTVNIKGPKGATGNTGANGATFTPTVDSSGNLSWSNDKALENPATVNIKGPKGATGNTGATGTAGVGIKTVAQTTTSSADGGTNVITVTKTDGTTSTFNVKNGSKGSTGATGAAGKGIKSTAITYQVGTSGTTPPTGTWNNSVVATTTAGQYLWTRTVITYTDNTTSTSYAIAAHGAKGATGATGPKGDPGNDYVLTATDKTYIATEASRMLQVPRYNLLDNSYFGKPVNQRGSTSYSTDIDTPWGACIDRWLIFLGTTMEIVDGAIRLTNPDSEIIIATRLEAGTVDFTNKQYTFVCCDAAGNLYFNGEPKDFVETNGYNELWVRFPAGSVDIVWAALYEGVYTEDNVPPYTPKGYAAELNECRRYYIEFRDVTIKSFKGDTFHLTNIQLPVQMRIAPSVTITDGSVGIMDNITIRESQDSIYCYMTTQFTIYSIVMSADL